jgi:hypothetical protein
MPYFFLDIPVDAGSFSGKNILPLVLISVFAIGGLAALFFWKKNNK